MSYSPPRKVSQFEGVAGDRASSWTVPAGWRQWALDVETELDGIVVRISTTIDVRTKKARAKGSNAMDVVVVDSQTGRLALRADGKTFKVVKILRTSGWEARLQRRVQDLVRAVESESLECDRCGGAMVLIDRTGGKIPGCSECPHEIDKRCHVCGEASMVLRRSKTTGVFWGCSSYPDCRAGLPWGKAPGEDRARELLKRVSSGGDPRLARAADKLLTRLDSDPTGTIPYVIGDKTPRGRPTFERIAKGKPKRKARKAKRRVDRGDPWEGIDLYAGDEESALVSIPEGGGPTRPADHFKHHELKYETLNPVQSAVLPYVSDNVNLVCAAATSAGKTTVAEMMMADALARGGKAIFLSPLKAVSQEKCDDWRGPEHPWSKLRVEIITGDYSLTESRKKALAQADVIVMTSEMLDSKTRRMDSEGNQWLLQSMCLVGSSRVPLADGRWVTIREIVERKLEVDVLAYDHDRNEVVSRRVVGWHKNPRMGRRLVRVDCGTARLTCTEDHEVYQRDVGYTPAAKLTSSSMLEVVDGGEEGTRVRGQADGEPGRLREVLDRRYHPGGLVDLVGVQEGLGEGQGQTLPSSAGRRVVEVREVEAARLDPPEGRVQPGLQQGQQGRHVLDSLLRRPGVDQAGVSSGGDYRPVPLVANRSCRPRSVVYGRRVTVSGIVADDPLSGVQPGDRRQARGVDDGRLGSRLLGGPGQEQEVLGPEVQDRVGREVHGSRQAVPIGAFQHGAQAPHGEGVAVLPHVRREVHPGSSPAPTGQEVGDLSVGGVLAQAGAHDGQDQRRPQDQGDDWVYDLTVEGTHNYFPEGILVHNCLVVDEAHMLTMPDRGDALECGIMRFTRQNPHSRVVLLSATMPNVSQLGEWLTRLNGKGSVVVESAWRPAKLTVHWPAYLECRDYHRNERSKRAEALALVMDRYPRDRWIIFVHSKKAGWALREDLRKRGEDAEFHSADLSKDQRITLEKRFRKGNLRVVIATSTLAYGINMPARRVLVLGVHRGIQEVDPIDVKQEVGRAGRVGLDPRGDAYVLVPSDNRNPHRAREIIERFQKIGNIESRINDLDVLAFHLTAEVAEGDVATERDAVEWHSRSLAALQGKILEQDGAEISAANVMERLASVGILKREGPRYVATMLGRVSSWLYYSPFDVADWSSNFRRLVESDRLRDDDCLAWALGCVKTSFDTYLPRENERNMREIEDRLAAKSIQGRFPAPVLAYHCMLKGVEHKAMTSIQRQLVQDSRRVVQALGLIDRYVIRKLGDTYLDLLGVRLRYGCSWRQADLCRLPGIGAKRARALLDSGIRSVEDVANKRARVENAIGKKLAGPAVRAAREIVGGGRDG